MLKINLIRTLPKTISLFLVGFCYSSIKEVTHMSKTALYMRMSTDKQDSSIESQEKALLKYAKSNKLTIVEKYIDKGISGRSATSRPAFMEMIEDSSTNKFDTILIFDSSRFARNLEESIVYKAALKRNNVSLISITEPNISGDESLITDAMLGALNEMFSRKLSKNVKRGMVHKAEQGFYQVPPPFGYTKENNIMVIVETEAEIVKKIFELYISKPSFTMVSRTINSLDIKKRYGKAFNPRDIKRILQNIAYVGKLCYCNNIYDGKHEGIISMEDFKKVQKDIEINSKQRMKSPNRYSHYLSGLLYCEKCGSKLGYQKDSKGGNAHMFRCNGHRDGICEYSNLLAVKKHEELFLASINIFLNQTMEAQKNYAFYEINNSGNNKSQDLEKAILNIDKRLTRVKEAYEAGIDTLEEYKENKLKLMKEKKDISAEIKSLSKNENLQDKIEKLILQLKILEDFINDKNKTIEDKNFTVRKVINKIIFDKYEKKYIIYYNI